MPLKNAFSPIKAVFPLSDTELVVRLSTALVPGAINVRSFSSAAGLRIRSAHIDERQPTRVVLTTSSMRSGDIVIDRINVQRLAFQRARGLVKASSPPFVLGVKNPTQLKVPHLESAFPFASRLVGVHVSVSCCTGCNGGIHDRNLVVLNHHVGGPWTGIWVQTEKTISTPYARWQKILCAGGVVAEQNGATTVVDCGWMEIEKKFEEPHHAPPALAIECAALPNSVTREVVMKGLDASWVQFNDIRVESAQEVAPSARSAKTTTLLRNEVVFTDRSGGRTTAYLYQPSGLKVETGQRLHQLRGFVHAEKPGRYVVLSDKEEDIVL